MKEELKTIEQIEQEIDAIPKEVLNDWYQNMVKQFKEDSKTHDFSISAELDARFRKAMFESLKSRKEEE